MVFLKVSLFLFLFYFLVLSFLFSSYVLVDFHQFFPCFTVICFISWSIHLFVCFSCDFPFASFISLMFSCSTDLLLLFLFFKFTCFRNFSFSLCISFHLFLLVLLLIFISLCFITIFFTDIVFSSHFLLFLFFLSLFPFFYKVQGVAVSKEYVPGNIANISDVKTSRVLQNSLSRATSRKLFLKKKKEKRKNRKKRMDSSFFPIIYRTHIGIHKKKYIYGTGDRLLRTCLHLHNLQNALG